MNKMLQRALLRRELKRPNFRTKEAEEERKNHTNRYNRTCFQLGDKQFFSQLQLVISQLNTFLIWKKMNIKKCEKKSPEAWERCGVVNGLKI